MVVPARPETHRYQSTQFNSIHCKPVDSVPETARKKWHQPLPVHLTKLRFLVAKITSARKARGHLRCARVTTFARKRKITWEYRLMLPLCRQDRCILYRYGSLEMKVRRPDNSKLKDFDGWRRLKRSKSRQNPTSALSVTCRNSSSDSLARAETTTTVIGILEQRLVSHSGVRERFTSDI